MFESVTKKRKNPLINAFGWTLLVLVCIVFVFVGFSPNSSFLGSGGAAGEVNGDAISLRDFKELLDRIDNNKQGASDREGRRRTQENAMNILVSRSLIVQEASKLNIHVSDSEVAQSLLDIEPFYEDGQFSRLNYKKYLRQARLTESEFESKIRKDLVIQKMSNLIGFAAKDVGVIDDFDEKIDQAQINVGYVLLSPNSIKAENKGNVSDFATQNSDKIKQYFDGHKSEFVTKEQVRARHILVKASDSKKENMDKALAKAVEVSKKLTIENFSDLAKKKSDDPGSKSKGGDLGFFSRGRMVPEFEKAAFTLDIGKISEPIKTQYGYHILLVDEKKPATEKKLDDVKNQIATQLMAKSQYEAFLTALKKHLKDKNYAEIENFVTSNQLKWTNTGFFSITKDNVPGIGENKQFLDIAMGLGAESEYADELVYKGDSAYLLKFKGAKMNLASGKNDQMDFFKKLMKQQKMNMLVQNWTDALRKEASVRINPDVINR